MNVGQKVRCPYCGSADVDYIDEHDMAYVESGFALLEWECTECEAGFTVKTEVTEIRKETFNYNTGEWERHDNR